MGREGVKGKRGNERHICRMRGREKNDWNKKGREVCRERIKNKQEGERGKN